MNKQDRQKVYEKFGGKCAYCGHDLDETWQVDHGVSKQYWFYFNPTDVNAVNYFNNLYPSCMVCNHYKRALCIDGNQSHRGFREYMKTFHTRLAKLPKKSKSKKTIKRIEYMLRIADRYNISQEKPFDGVFYFEKYNQQLKSKQ